jgi:pyrimidine-specific ribonucleoside hydrolase
VRSEPLAVRVECGLGPARGATVADRTPGVDGPPVHVALDADVEAVLGEILRRLHTLG